MKEIIISFIAFIIIYLFYLLFVILRKKKLEKFKDNMYVKYLVNMYQLDLTKINIKSLANIIALVNSFIIASVLYCVSITDNMILQVLLAFAILIPLQILGYYIIGKVYQKKGKCKNE